MKKLFAVMAFGLLAVVAAASITAVYAGGIKSTGSVAHKRKGSTKRREPKKRVTRRSFKPA